MKVCLVLSVLLVGILCFTSAHDPCLIEEQEGLFQALGMGMYMCPGHFYSCDSNLSPGWYSMDTDNFLPTSCKDIPKCGSFLPIWINGTIPSVADGVVNRIACISYMEDCCKSRLEIKLKNCSSHLVYHLEIIPICPPLYCTACHILPPPPTTTTTTTTTTTARPRECDDWYYGSECKGTCQCKRNNTEQCSKVDGTCTCNAGWQGVKCEDDVNECLQHPCFDHSQCLNEVGSYKCQCVPGFTEEQGHCIDIDECDSDPCVERSKCINVAGTFRCQCLPGYRDISGQCEDIDECKGDPCDEKSECVNQAGTFRCECFSGYRESRGQCEECGFWTFGQECQSQCTCDMKNTDYCSKTDGRCVCKDGWMGTMCAANINECLSIVCGDNAICVNNAGTYGCRCAAGYQDVDGICIDIDECANNDPCGETSMCVNEDGSFHCICSLGYIDFGGECADIDECANNNPCGETSMCVNEDGSFRCICSLGYVDVGGKCEDIDECANNNPCGETSMCVNEDGSFRCICSLGYVDVGGKCADIDECANNDPCGETSMCVNEDGSFHCICSLGYIDFGGECADPSTLGQSAIGTSDNECAIHLITAVITIICLLVINVITVIMTCTLTRKKYRKREKCSRPQVFSNLGADGYPLNMGYNYGGTHGPRNNIHTYNPYNSISGDKYNPYASIHGPKKHSCKDFLKRADIDEHRKFPDIKKHSHCNKTGKEGTRRSSQKKDEHYSHRRIIQLTNEIKPEDKVENLYVSLSRATKISRKY